MQFCLFLPITVKGVVSFDIPNYGTLSIIATFSSLYSPTQMLKFEMLSELVLSELIRNFPENQLEECTLISDILF
jgi:hypothetical protein